jgi:hypothetical protein
MRLSPCISGICEGCGGPLQLTQNVTPQHLDAERQDPTPKADTSYPVPRALLRAESPCATVTFSCPRLPEIYQMTIAYVKRLVLVLACAAAVPVFAADVDVGVSINIGDPNFYGRIELGDFPQPRLLYRRPIVIERVRQTPEPLYLRVPPGHAKNWRKHCHEYDACGRPVYFVEDRWYNEVYAPRYRERHGDHHDRGHDDDHHDNRDKHKD